MKRRVMFVLSSLFSSLFFLQPVFGQVFGYRTQPRANFVAQVSIGGAPWKSREE